MELVESYPFFILSGAFGCVVLPQFSSCVFFFLIEFTLSAQAFSTAISYPLLLLQLSYILGGRLAVPAVTVQFVHFNTGSV